MKPIKDRNNIELCIGDRVMHFARRDASGNNYHPDYIGVIVDINVDRLPLIDVDCGVEFVRGIPHMDLVH